MNTTESASERVAAWRAIKASEKIRIRDGAARLGCPEGELLAAHAAAGESVIALVPRWEPLFEALRGVGRVMALTRNDVAVHERKGCFEEVQFFGEGPAMGQAVGKDLDMRFFPRTWSAAFAVSDNDASGLRESLQIFDRHGEAVLKIYPQPEVDRPAWQAIGGAFAGGAPPAWEPVPGPTPDLPDAEIDVEGLRNAWRGLQDTHAFHGMLREYRVGRTQAHRLVGEEFATPVSPEASEQLLLRAAASRLPIMVFVGNRGNIQIHTGEVSTIKRLGEWVNVLDPDFNLHLNEPGIASAWRVRKPTRDGIVTSIELFDEAGENVALFFGKRKPGQEEDSRWREMAEALA